MTASGTMKLRVAEHGLEKQPVIIIDEFIADPERLIEDASMLSFQPIDEHYPGIRAAVHPALVAGFTKDIAGMIADVFGLSLPFPNIECWYSLVTTPPEALRPIQRLPHFDSADAARIALLHYLAPDGFGGTSFFRHRATGFESVTEERVEQYSAAIDADAARYGLPAAAYISGDTPVFEKIAHYEARFNRAIIYRGNTIHCADIPIGMPLSTDPAKGRLTVNTFIHGCPAPAA
jgi:Family of unknown function (DUF6445)